MFLQRDPASPESSLNLPPPRSSCSPPLSPRAPALERRRQLPVPLRLTGREDNRSLMLYGPGSPWWGVGWGHRQIVENSCPFIAVTSPWQQGHQLL